MNPTLITVNLALVFLALSAQFSPAGEANFRPTHRDLIKKKWAERDAKAATEMEHFEAVDHGRVKKSSATAGA